MLKDRNNYAAFYRDFLKGKDIPYEICFNDWLENYEYYKVNDTKNTKHFKKWYNYIVDVVGTETMFDFLLYRQKESVDGFVVRFCNAYNKLADRLKLDPVPLPQD